MGKALRFPCDLARNYIRVYFNDFCSDFYTKRHEYFGKVDTFRHEHRGDCTSQEK